MWRDESEQRDLEGRGSLALQYVPCHSCSHRDMACSDSHKNACKLQLPVGPRWTKTQIDNSQSKTEVPAMEPYPFA